MKTYREFFMHSTLIGWAGDWPGVEQGTFYRGSRVVEKVKNVPC
jgi:hypothetical protein